jgi:hypothetical protein
MYDWDFSCIWPITFDLDKVFTCYYPLTVITDIHSKTGYIEYIYKLLKEKTMSR